MSPDRTPSEIQSYKELRKELDRRIKNGESDLIIRKGKIVAKGSTEEQVGTPRQEEQVNVSDRE